MIIKLFKTQIATMQDMAVTQTGERNKLSCSVITLQFTTSGQEK
jgi:hypothetical protein